MLVTSFGEFVRARRGALRPADTGPGTRRVPGLRREEVATLVGVSEDYYRRLEQGREQHPSVSVLTALSRALQLSPDAERHLFALASIAAPPRPSAPSSAVLQGLLDDWTAHPAVLIDRATTVVAGNRLGLAVFGGHAHSHNLAELIFLDPDAESFYADRPERARGCVAGMRDALSDDPGDPLLTATVDRLRSRSPEFAGLWARAEVAERTNEPLELNHPLVGRLSLTQTILRPAGFPDLLLKVLRAEPDSETAVALATLGHLTAREAEPVGPR